MVKGPFLLWYGLVVGLAAAGLALAVTLDAPRAWFLLGLTLIALATGTHYLSLAHEGYRFHKKPPLTFPYWIPPMALALGGALFTREFLGGVFLLAGLIGIGAGVAVLLYCQHLLARPDGSPPPFAHIATRLASYLAAFLLFVSIPSSELTESTGIVMLGLVTVLLAQSFFRDRAVSHEREAIYSAVVALLIMELAWALSLLPLGKIMTGLVLLIAFYLVSGLVHNYLLNRLTRWVVLEFVAVSAIALVVLVSFKPLAG